MGVGRLTKSLVDSLPLPEGRAKYYWDSDLKGFGVRVNPHGRKVYIAQGSYKGKAVKVTIGVHGLMPIEEARTAARGHLYRISKGEDPRGVRACEITLEAALALHLRARRHSLLTVKQYLAAVDRYLPDWKHRPLVEIDRPAARKRHEKITAKHGPYVANLALRIFRAAWNRASREHPELHVCPTINVDWNEELPRRSAVPAAELPQLYRRILGVADPVRRDYVLFVLFSGQRRQAVAEIRWENVDLAARTLHFPNPKGGPRRAFDLPLSNYLVKILRRRLSNRLRNSPWVFPGNSHAGHLSDPRVEGLPSPHALRHTWASAAVAAGLTPYQLKLLLNHALPRADVTAGYIRVDADALREVLQRVEDYLLARIRPPEGWRLVG